MEAQWTALIGLVLGGALAHAFWSRRVAVLEATKGAQQRVDEDLLARARADAERLQEEALARAKLEAQALRQEADASAKNLLLGAEETIHKSRLEAASSAERARAEAEAEGRAAAEKLRAEGEERRRTEEARLASQEAALREKVAAAASREAKLALREKENRERERELREREQTSMALVAEGRAKLEALAGMSGEEARRRLMADFVDDARRRSAREAKTIEDGARDEAEKRAKRILGIAIQRYAGDHAQERASTTVHLPSDEMKGRIIGREGRNIRALQEATGVDFIVDDTPETIVVAGFDPVRREVARLALEKLMADGRIHPTRIEEVVLVARQEVLGAMRAAADAAIDELGLTRVAPELAELVGQLRYRYSYAQNVLKHSIECGYIAGLMAGELGLDVQLARRAGLLHDLGKAVSHEAEGGHAMVGGRIARKHGEDPIVANAIACHHEDEPCISVYGYLVTAADALSGARPGARREMLESYVKRLGDLERISNTFAGVERSYAIQAGREVRVVVEPGEVSDEEAALLAREISKRIESELVYPGQIRVTVVRETRAVDYAK